jgi:hypothetical protein
MRDGSEERDSGKTFEPASKYDNVEPAPLPPMAADGGPVPGAGIGQPAPTPKATADNCVCLRGPCRHYWHLVTTFPSGNPGETWEALEIDEPRQHHHLCLVHEGLETDLTDDCVFECSRWDPNSDDDQRDSDREKYYAAHPDHRPGAGALTEDALPPIEDLDDADETTTPPEDSDGSD